MHRLKDRTYVGSPGETVTISLTLENGGQARATLNGVPIPGRTFPLPAAAGDGVRLEIQLTGPVGASCVVGIAEVDGGEDGDLLLCQPHDPSPVQFYDFSVASMAAVGRLAAMRGVRSSAAARALRAQPPQADSQRKARKSGKKASGTARKKTARKRGGKR